MIIDIMFIRFSSKKERNCATWIQVIITVERLINYFLFYCMFFTN